jgi:hypothetical protein
MKARLYPELPREDVVAVVNSELDYQETMWNGRTTISGGEHSVGEYLGFMRSYLRRAEDAMAFQGEPGATDEALEIVRKLTAMGFRCMMQNGAPRRGGF